MPKLSIITVCKNQKDIQDTIDSIICQTFTDFEWIVIDGASVDDTVEKLKKVKDKIDVFISEPDKGIYNAMNKGIKCAKGEYLLFLNGGDNLVSCDTLKNVFDLNLNADIIYGNTNMVNSDNSFKLFWNVDEVKEKDYFVFNNISHQSSFIKKELFEKYGMYNENNKICSDTEAFCIFLHNNAEFKKIEMTISNHKNDGISSVNRKKTLDERHRMIKKYYTERDIRAKINLKNSFLEKIFSIKNIDVYKCIYVLGFKIIIQMYGK